MTAAESKAAYEEIKDYVLKQSVLMRIVYSQYLIIAIFDNMSPDYEKIKNLLIGTELIGDLDFNTLVKVHFKRENIATSLRMFKPIVHSTLLQAMGDGHTKIDVKFEDETAWLTQEQLCELYQTSQSNISEHIKRIFGEEELDEELKILNNIVLFLSECDSFCSRYFAKKRKIEMKLHTLKCQNCGANLEIENGIDTFYCRYCGSKIILEDLSDASIDAKIKIKKMEHKEKIREKEFTQERYKMEFKSKNEWRSVQVGLGMLAVIVIIGGAAMMFGNSSTKKQDRELQAIVDEILIDIEKENFTKAYVKANSLYWDDSWSSKGEDKWDAIREAVIDQIEEAEVEATGKSTAPKKGIFSKWFD